MGKSTERSKVAKLSHYRDGKDANNLAEFPLALLTDKAPPGAKTLEFEDTITDWSTGKEVRQRVCITGSDKFGLPTAKDEDVLLALVQLTRLANNFTSPEVWFTKRQVIEILGWENRGWAYDRVEESLHRWKGVSIHYWNAWRDKARGTWCDSEAIGFIEYFRITDGRRRSAANDVERRSRFVWNKALFESFQAGYLKPLDFEIYRKLERPAARRAYRFFDKRFYHKPLWEFELRQLACEKLGFSRNYDTGQLKERLKPALGELEQIGLIEPVRFHKRRPREWMVGISKHSSELKQPAPVGSKSSLANELVRRGIEPRVAQNLAAEFPAERIAEKIGYYDWLTARRDRKVSKNRAGFLVASIQQNYTLPREYLRRHKKTVQPQQQPSKIPAAETRENKGASNPSHGSGDFDPTAAFVNQLGEAERANLEARAVAEAGKLEAASYHRLKVQGGELFRSVQLSLLSKYVLRHGLHVPAATEVLRSAC